MLIYHPALDVNHGMFRMLRLLETNPEHKLQWDTYRILDFYYLFPHLLSEARLPHTFIKWKKRFAKTKSAYTYVPSPRQFIQQLETINESVARSLAAKGLIDPTLFKQRVLARTDRPLPKLLKQDFKAARSDQDLTETLAIKLAAIPLSGNNGLKHRTGILEHRYDPL